MLLAELNGIRKSFGERQIISLDSFRIYEGERVGLVGLNGAGKTTFLEILAGGIRPDEGTVNILGSWEYIRQTADGQTSLISGGEKTIERIDRAFAEDVHLLMADEPTCNLSLTRIDALRERLLGFKGGLLLISHDRALLNAICNRIIEIENGMVKEYSGNYDFYRAAKERERGDEWARYESYAKEKARLKSRADRIKRKANTMTKAPKRMGNSEARLQRGAIRQKSGHMGRIGEVLEGRMKRLEQVAKPRKEQYTKIDIPESARLYAKIALEVRDAAVLGLFAGVGFRVANGSKTALIGENGVGKTTLLRMIMNDDSSVIKAAGLRIAYFSQETEFDEGADIYTSAAKGSAMSQTEIRGILARMLFRGEDVYKPVRLLSGGERVKVALCKIFCRDVNMLILDEPNNYLDLHGMEALEGLIRDYGGTILYVSHDRGIVELADTVLELRNGRLTSMDGEDFRNPGIECAESAKLITEIRIAALMGEISERSRRNEDITDLNNELMRLMRER